MAHISGEDRSQLLLLPDAVDDYVGPDNPVRFSDAFVDGLDLAAAGFLRVQPAGKGRPGYDPADLLKLYIYGYLNRIRSSRRLEAHRQTLDDTGEAQPSIADPDSRSMHTVTRVGVGYNVQVAVDTRHNLFAEQQVHSQVTDLGLLAETAVAARENLAVCEIDAVADRGLQDRRH